MRWYQEKLSSDASCLWVLEKFRKVVAQVRYDRVAEQTAEIDIAVAPDYRGKGVGALLLKRTWKQACRALGVTRMRGVAKETNMASQRAFLAAGFLEAKSGLVRGYPCLMFERVYAETSPTP